MPDAMPIRAIASCRGLGRVMYIAKALRKRHLAVGIVEHESRSRGQFADPGQNRAGR